MNIFFETHFLRKKNVFIFGYKRQLKLCLAISLSSGAAVLEDNHESNAYTEV